MSSDASAELVFGLDLGDDDDIPEWLDKVLSSQKNKAFRFSYYGSGGWVGTVLAFGPSMSGEDYVQCVDIDLKDYSVEFLETLRALPGYEPLESETPRWLLLANYS